MDPFGNMPAYSLAGGSPELPTGVMSPNQLRWCLLPYFVLFGHGDSMDFFIGYGWWWLWWPWHVGDSDMQGLQ